MTDIHRYYKCGCAPDDEQFCKLADEKVWKERQAAMDRAGEGHALPITRPEAERLAYREGQARGWLIEHYRLQDDLGFFEDVDFDAPEMQEPDDGYDEDPRVVGYPS